jgi:hypothetical protein
VYDTPDNYDMDKLNKDVNSYKFVIIVGNFIDVNKINFKCDISFYMDTSFINFKTYIVEHDIIKDDKMIDIYVYKIFKPRYSCQ